MEIRRQSSAHYDSLAARWVFPSAFKFGKCPDRIAKVLWILEHPAVITNYARDVLKGGRILDSLNSSGSKFRSPSSRRDGTDDVTSPTWLPYSTPYFNGCAPSLSAQNRSNFSITILQIYRTGNIFLYRYRIAYLQKDYPAISPSVKMCFKTTCPTCST